MPEWRLVDLNGMDGYKIQSVYEAIAKTVGAGKSPNTLILCYPSSPYVCIGVHQEVEKEVNLEYCNQRNIPVVRRRVGGGTVYLDNMQQFYQLVIKAETQILDVKSFYKKYLQPTVYVYRKYGLPAEYKPINDVVIRGRKASGNGAMTLDNSHILIGNVLLDIDYDAMVNVLKTPSEKFRDKLAKTIREWLTCLKRELGYVPDREEVKKYLIEGYKEILGINLVPGELTEEEITIWKEIESELKSEEWLYNREKDHAELLSLVSAKCTKVAGGIKICEATYKAEKLLRITMSTKDDVITEVLISGDFFMEPYTALKKLEKTLIGTRLYEEKLLEKINSFLESENVKLVGAKPEDLVKALLTAYRKVG